MANWSILKIELARAGAGFRGSIFLSSPGGASEPGGRGAAGWHLAGLGNCPPPPAILQLPTGSAAAAGTRMENGALRGDRGGGDESDAPERIAPRAAILVQASRPGHHYQTSAARNFMRLWLRFN